MGLAFVPTPQRCIEFNGISKVSKNDPIILQVPDENQDYRIIEHVKEIFQFIKLVKGNYALFSENSFAPIYEMNYKEGYLLSIQEDTLQISSNDEQGLFYGLQTVKQWFDIPGKPTLEISDWPNLFLRSDYLDMRGLFPKFENLLNYIKEMAHFKLNTLVVEYEDKLPRKREEFCHPTQSWTKEQLNQFLKVAEENFINIIPLQQTFGHLEYALKLPEYEYLRETPETVGEMCPLKKGAFELAASLIEESVELHPNSKYIHLGCDEVWSLGQSEECKKSGLTRGQISVQFINKLAEKTVSLGKTPVVWHDMLAEADDESLAKLNKSIIVAVWLYSPEDVNTIAPNLEQRLHTLGIRTIPCSAIRAFDHAPGQNYPCVEQRLRNVDSWIELIQQTRSSGMINTNWCSSFSFGNPYGLFETSRYTAFYAADSCWNIAANRDNFLERFLATYHGVYNKKIFGGKERRYDYYKLIGQILPQVKRNEKTAELIDIMYHLENVVFVNYTEFRGAMFPNSKVEIDCLKERAPKNYRDLEILENRLQKLLPELLIPEMEDIFFTSRTYTNRLLQKNLGELIGEEYVNPKKVHIPRG